LNLENRIMSVKPKPRVRIAAIAAGLILAVAPGASAADGATNSQSVVVQTNIVLPSQVKFRNGDSLQGSLLAIDAQKQVHWTNPAIEPVMKFPASEVSKMRLTAPPGAPQGSNNTVNCVLRLLGGDQFTGNLVSMDEATLLLDTWYAGRLTFPRRQVRWVRSVQGGGYLYQGPDGLDGWIVSASVDPAVNQEPAWTYGGGAFLSHQAGGIGRDLKLPDRAAMDFDVAWKQSLQLTITIYTESLQVYRLPTLVGVGGVVVVPQNPVPAQPAPGAGFYAVHLNANGAYLMTVRPNGDVGNSSSELIPGLEKKSSAHFSLRVDKLEKTISLIVDDKLVKTWQEPAEFAGHGTGVRFVQQGASPLSLNHLKVGRWDGKLDAPLAASTGDASLAKPALPVSTTNDLFQLKNQDAFAGVLKEIRDGTLFVNTSFSALKFPLERVSEIDFATDKTAPAPDADSVRACFSDSDGQVTFHLLEWKAGKVTVTSPVFGRAEFSEAAFSTIEFAPANNKP
jgi:hypothetical protein